MLVHSSIYANLSLFLVTGVVVEMLLICFYILFSSGFVYNVTPYMEYHPGGEDELMKAAGTDGTDLFDQVGTTGSK